MGSSSPMPPSSVAEETGNEPSAPATARCPHPGPTLTEPRDVLVLPHDRLFAGPLSGPPARGPPERVHVGTHVEVRPAQQSHAPKALLGWATGDLRSLPAWPPPDPARQRREGALTFRQVHVDHEVAVTVRHWGIRAKSAPVHTQGSQAPQLPNSPRKPSCALSTMKSTLYTSRGLAS